MGDQIEKNEMGEACSTYWAKRGVYRALEGRNHLEDLCVDGIIILKLIFK